MATSGSKTVTVTSWDTLKFSWSLKSQSVANNTSTISWKLELIATSSGRISSTTSKHWHITVNGTEYSGTNTIGISNNSTKTLASGTTTISHNPDGTKTFSYSFSQEIAITFSDNFIGTKSGSGTGTLTTIPRKSTLSANDGTLGVAQPLTVTRQSSNLTHTITYSCGSASGIICTKSSSTGIAFTPPLSLASQNTTGTKVAVKFTITTYSGNTSLGSNTKTIACSIPSSVKPSCSISVSDAAGYSVYVKGYSKFKITVKPTTAYGSDIASYSVKANGATYTTASVTTSVLASSGSLTITATVTDKRGRTATATKTVTVYEKSTLSASNGTLDTAQNLTISRGYSGFKHTIKYSCGSASGTIATKTSDTTISFKPPISLASQNTTGTTVSVKFTITTYCDDKSIGSNTKTITCSIPSSVAPTVEINVEDSTGLDAFYGRMVKGHSRLQINLNLTPSYGADITSISTTVFGVRYNQTSVEPGLTSTTIDAGVVKSSGGFSIMTSVADERGRIGTTINDYPGSLILDYSPPNISKLAVGRCDKDGNPNDKGEYAKVTFSASVSAIYQNYGVYTLKYKKATQGSYPSDNVVTFGNELSLKNETFIFAADTGSSYDIYLQVDDTLETVTKTTTVSTAFTLMHFHKDGQGMAIGKVSEDSTFDYLDLGLHTVMQNNKYLCGMSLATEEKPEPTPIRMLYVNANNNTILGYGGYLLGYGTTNIYGNQINFGVREGGIVGGKELFYKPYYEKGDTINVSWLGAGYITTSSTQICFTIPLAKPVIGNPVVVASSTVGFYLRQYNSDTGKRYTHGSSNGGRTTSVSSYGARLVSGNYIEIVVSMSDTTNAENNSPIGIDWDGTITFE